MSIYESTCEIGMKDKAIGLSMILESAFIGIIGSIAGIIVSIPFVYLLVNHSINYGWMIRDFNIGYRIASVFYGAWNLSTFLEAFLMGTIIAIVLALFPVRRAFKRSIVDCLRYS